MLDDPAALEHGDVVRACRRGEPVRDQQPGAPREQALRGRHHTGLGDRVHPGRRLVQHDHPDVAHQQPGERDQLLLAGGQRRAARAEHGVQPVRQPLHPGGQAQLVHGFLDPPARQVGEQGDVLGERAGQDLGPLGDHADRGPQPLQVQVEDVDAVQQHRAALGLDRPGQQRRQRGLAGAAATHQRQGGARGDDQIDLPQRERALRVGEVQVPQLEGRDAVRQRPTALGLGFAVQQPAQPDQGADAGLQVRHVPGDLVDLADERRGDQEQGDQRRCGLGALDDQQDAHDGHPRQHPVQQQPGPTADPALQRDDLVEPGVHRRRQLGAAPHEIGLAEAGAQVVPRGHALLHRGGVVRPGHLLDDLALGQPGQQRTDQDVHRDGAGGQQQPRRPPRPAGHDQQRTSAQHQPDHRPRVLPQQRADLVGVVVHPVQHLADRLLGERRQRLVHHGVQQVGTQRALGPVDGHRPPGATRRVEQRRAHHADRQHPDQRHRRVVREPARGDGAERLTHPGQPGRDQGEHRARTTQPPPVQRRAALAEEPDPDAVAAESPDPCVVCSVVCSVVTATASTLRGTTDGRLPFSARPAWRPLSRPSTGLTDCRTCRSATWARSRSTTASASSSCPGSGCAACSGGSCWTSAAPSPPAR